MSNATLNATYVRTVNGQAVGPDGNVAVSGGAELPSWGVGTGPFDPALAAYNLRPDNMRKWRAAKARAAAGLGQAHVSTMIDSITYGATSATSNPKHIYTYPARLRDILQGRLGDGGTGIATPWDIHELVGTPAADNRFTYAGAWTNRTFGVYAKGARETPVGAGNYVEFTARCDEFVIYHMTSSGGYPRVTVDGGAEANIAAAGTATGQATYQPETGHWGHGTLTQILVTHVPAGELGQHTLRIMPPSASGKLVLLGVEGRIAGKGVRVSNLGLNGRASAQLAMDDTTNHYFGMSIALDSYRADLAVMLLGMNDYQGHVPVATFKANVAAAIDRQRSTGAQHAAGDVLLVTCPQPNYAAPIPADGVLDPPLSAYYTALYELANEKDVPLLDMAWRWTDYTVSSGLGFFGDALHPNNLGSSDIAQALGNVLLSV
ncbi:SGNH/GDSL hydrolase family protein [Rhodococcus sp. A5(2022)]|uniref:SGNH/GDSL hydrolase family protein n=1 Tax=Rhodococcus sp. A5(2022) TaxID=3003588 RepID=UPI0022A86265|nr:SGNH/GDSL hydrolase family protein [Rhodococcus sp. A5(2022)]MCZ1070822.1 SGNH/GDSL hydrolase family protein [Rhodococcus sp. A5(2022)]